MNLDKLINYYEDNIRRHGNDFKSLGWGSRATQEVRFEVLSQVAPLAKASVLDVGCGLGDLYEYLLTRFKELTYSGMDLVPAMVEAARARFPSVDFQVGNIMDGSLPPESHDYVLASGIFNRRVPEHEHFVQESIKAMYATCRKAVAFNMMSTRTQKQDKKEYHGDPGAFLDFCLDLGAGAILRHDYLPHDFTIYLYKEEQERI
ncbi:MAG: class I SAM-dependent methyltransferase [Planctomycetes bacterium]|nr:class I SAM-dependent methyltransferase [Planctomycetota bacterium]